MKIFNFIFLTFLLLQGCGRNYEKELEAVVNECQLKGAEILAVSDLRHFVIYKCQDSLWVKNLDKPAKKILYPKQEITLVSHNLYFDSYGKPYIQKNIEKVSFGDPLLYRTPDSVKLCKEDLAFTFSKYNWLSEIKYELYEYTYFLYKPDSIFLSRVSPVVNDKEDYVQAYTADLETALYGKSRHPIHNSGYFTWGFKLDEQGEVVDKQEFINYKFDDYNEEKEEFEVVSSIVFDVQDFSSREKAQKVLLRVSSIVDAAKESRRKEEEKEEIKRLLDESISIGELKAAFEENSIKAQKKYVGKTLYINCQLESIQENNNSSYDLEGYSYKLITDSFGAIAEIKGYTNDESFVDLSYPESVIMKATLVDGTTRRFRFKDCELLAW